ncbi:phage tail protein [Chitinimonas koreensis]|uniref:phage tail protein n=1 Tax=Chitinimonas koreensis TaxID=356302 RepID=UPI00041920B1|nr:phage tail protein [Chitinimonas koreensis]QNM98650.1 hypothetical protein H9L41_10760 [Chitinimonas koreensis]
MIAGAPTSGLVEMRGRPHWLRCGFDATALADEVVTLAPDPAGDHTLPEATPFAGGFAGPVFDRHCRLFHPLPETGGLEFLAWGKRTTLGVAADAPAPYELSGAESESGGFGGDAPLPFRPVALACDEADYLYIADPGDGGEALASIWLVDTWQHEVARQVATSGRPLDVAYARGRAYALLDTPAWLSLSPCDPPQPLPWPAEVPAADRLDVAADGRAFVLLDAGQASAELRCLHDHNIVIAIPYCTDFLIGEHDPELGWLLVFARRPGEDFLRRRLNGRHVAPLAGLAAPGYDGRGIARAPDGRIAYWTARGLRHAAPARPSFLEAGTVFGFALDSGLDQAQWGRILIEACIPDGTRLTVRCYSRDDLDELRPIERKAPAGEALLPLAEETRTPLPGQAMLDYGPAAGQPLYRDDSPRPLAPPGPDGFARYEAPVIAPPGRYLWLVFEFAGTRSKTPRLRSVQAEYPGHGLLGQLPRTLWREPAARDFLQRYLAPIAATLGEWGAVGDGRHRLLDPRVAPAEALDWLAGFVGLALDPVWPEAARRRLIAEAATLFRCRGTLQSLQRMITLLTGAEAIVIETFRLRGGGVAGNPEATASRSVLGSGFRVGGSIGRDGETALPEAAEQPFEGFAHRFSVTVLADLDDAQLRAVRKLIETHKPAHTMFDVCGAAVGTRVGVGLHVGLASMIGKSSGFDPLVLGDAVLGKGYTLGRPELDRAGREPGSWQ